MTARLSKGEELAALELLEAALEESPDDPAAQIRAAGNESREVRERALRLLSASEQSESVLATGGASALGLSDEDDAPLPKQIGAYRVVALLGRGGMGAVYRGERVEADFDHDVAIKVIRPGIVSDSLAERFRRERRILASLRHPNIAQLYDGGETADGAPYIVMEFIDGISVSRWLRNESPDLVTRLALFAQICDAVEFAHQNLIVHRDLTPGNVLVDTRGDAKLIDFGIARPQDDGDAQPQSPLSQLSLTPGFAAPERKQGAAVTTLVDIYSLGRILQVMLDKVDAPELDAIAAKAIHDDPEQRYASAALLARDVENYRSGLPVAVYSDTRAYRMRKYVGRHRLPAALAAFALVVLVGSLLAITDAWRDERRARANAEQRFEDTRTLANTLMFDLFDKVGRLDDSEEVRLEMAQLATAYLDRLSNDPNAPPDVQAETGDAYIKMSKLMGFADPVSLGRMEEAETLVDRGVAILEGLHEQKPRNPAVTESLANALTERASFAFFAKSDPASARADAERAKRLLENQASYSESAASTLLRAHYMLGRATLSAGEGDAAQDSLAIFNQGLRRAEQWPAGIRDALPVRRVVAALYGGRSSSFIPQQKFDEMLATLAKSIEIRREIVRETETNRGDIFQLAGTLRDQAIALCELGDGPGCEDAIAEGFALMRPVVAANPKDTGSALLLASLGAMQANVAFAAGRSAEALRLIEEADALNRKALAQTGDTEAGLGQFAMVQVQVVHMDVQLGRKQKACDGLRELDAVFDQIRQGGGKIQFGQDRGAEHLHGLMPEC